MCRISKEAQRIFHENALWVPIAHTTPSVGIVGYVKGFKLQPMEHDDLAKVTIEK